MVKALHTPERSCCVTHTTLPRAALLRLALAPSGEVVADLTGSLPGRGVYVLPTLAAIEKALDKKLLSRAFGQEVKALPTLAALVGLVRQDILARLGFAKKANKLVIGGSEFMAARGKVKAVFLAQDAGSEARKLAAQVSVDAEYLVTVFSKFELESALGVPNCSLVGAVSLDIFGQNLHKWREFLRNKDTV